MLSRAVDAAPPESLRLLAGAIAFMTLVAGLCLAALHFARPFLWPDPPVSAGSEELPAAPVPAAFPGS